MGGGEEFFLGGTMHTSILPPLPTTKTKRFSPTRISSGITQKNKKGFDNSQ